ncbi:chorismate--pyruvate lyase [Anaerocolumna sp. AGMB13025]|uniref:chorismate--pyruvate lyase n=1 Tax=Anaerocolumna sp. AGMB13025 TaxID=3039116 RepID=UPI00241D6BBA|nr:chorismate--pyruvate lyase [Anaerocolumna sp. AGMB13025]WFR59109.1 chorismate--pyruvate lyase [Anaerocolumna sp. AGMB13025]
MEIWNYLVEKIDGDYAYLRRTDIPDNDLKLVARAILPAEISEGTCLKYELFEYTIIE